MKKILSICFLLTGFIAFQANAQSKNIVEIAAGSEMHSTLVAAVKAGNLAETLSSKGPFTVFAPVNDAFSNLPAGTVESLLKPENKESLVKILTYHVVSGNLDAATVVKAIKDGKGKASLTTVSGDMLTASIDNGKVKLTDEKGRTSYVTTADLKASNGVIHVIDTVILPE